MPPAITRTEFEDLKQRISGTQIGLMGELRKRDNQIATLAQAITQFESAAEEAGEILDDPEESSQPLDEPENLKDEIQSLVEGIKEEDFFSGRNKRHQNNRTRRRP